MFRGVSVPADSKPQFETLEPRLLLSTTYEVDSLADNHLLDDLVTLREAVEAANSDTAVGDAEAGDGADVIQFHPSLAGLTIVLDGNQLVVGEDLTIVGLGADQLTIDADNRVRHFQVEPGVTLTMSDVTLDNGNAGEGTNGGAIYSDGTLVLTDCVLSNNRAGIDGGAIYGSSQSPSISLTDCDLLSNTAVGLGGGVYRHNGQLSLSGGRFEQNRATTGGGVYSKGSGALSIDGTDFTDNEAVTDGGAVRTGQATTITGGAEFLDNQAGRYGGAIRAYTPLGIMPLSYAQYSSPSKCSAPSEQMVMSV